MIFRSFPAFVATLVAAWPISTYAAPAAGDITIHKNLPYRSGADLSPLETKYCQLDLYLPPAGKGFATMLWFHGGGLTSGDKAESTGAALSLARGGIAVVSANYRLSPDSKFPAYVQDAAAAFIWTRDHIADYGGDPHRIFVGGHSAGGWLALLIGLDPEYLRAAGSDPSAIAGLIPVSGQVVTHFTVRAERGLGEFEITADDAAPIRYGRKDTVPILDLYAEHDRPARAEENIYFVSVMKGAGNQQVTGLEIKDRDHVSIATHLADPDDPARAAILQFIAHVDAPPTAR